MELTSDYETLCERYLLGELSESEAERLEQIYFTDDALFERYLSVKDELLDAYARGDLKGKKLERFEEHYLSTRARRQRVEENRDLIQVASGAATKVGDLTEGSGSANRQRFPGWQLFAKNVSLHPVMSRVGLIAALLVIVIGVWLVVRQVQHWNARVGKEERAKTENVNNSAVPSPTSSLSKVGQPSTPSPSSSPTVKPDVVPERPHRTSAQIASLTLLPVSTRETGNVNSLILREDQRVVRLSVVLSDAGYDRFDVSLRTVDGQNVFRSGGLKSSSSATGKTVIITFDSSLLNRQDYIVTVIGRGKEGKSATVGEYYFRVQHTPPQQ